MATKQDISIRFAVCDAHSEPKTIARFLLPEDSKLFLPLEIFFHILGFIAGIATGVIAMLVCGHVAIKAGEPTVEEHRQRAERILFYNALRAGKFTPRKESSPCNLDFPPIVQS